ncbi:hypothetical protein [Pseudomonas phage COT4]|uniref:Uncharacterized protein n=1 Tax=Pseudomonas phage M5.1 TaxID=2873460 RepID=A0AAE8XGK6_9CAUD|nr:hypothetical protein QGX13_gp139 [Pseudomonas phage M5.1]UAV89685.1 hypothetical protein M51_103 [Pseudomonas phage M5.1]UGL61285.1 hypothetical protein [Pseudomonas phage COT4]
MTIKAHLKEHMSSYVMATNAMIAVSTAAFAILGVFSGTLTTPVLVGNAFVFGTIWAVGKFGNEQLEDMEHENLYNCANPQPTIVAKVAEVPEAPDA